MGPHDPPPLHEDALETFLKQEAFILQGAKDAAEFFTNNFGIKIAFSEKDVIVR